MDTNYLFDTGITLARIQAGTVRRALPPVVRVVPVVEVCETCDAPAVEPVYSVGGGLTFCSPTCRAAWESAIES